MLCCRYLLSQTNKQKSLLGCSLHLLRSNAHVHVLGLLRHAFSFALFLFILHALHNSVYSKGHNATGCYWDREVTIRELSIGTVK